MAHPRNESGALWWVRRWWRALLAELVATALLVALGCAAQVPLGGPGSVVLTHPALAFGFLVTALVCAFGEASGAHMNPAVTLAVLLSGHLGALPALAYVLAQCVGATLGFAALAGAMPEGLVRYPVGATVPAEGVSLAAAVLVEATITGVLVLAACALPERDPAAPVKLGLVVAGLIYSAGPMTGASLNPARSLGPAVQHGAWSLLWVYWVGPLAGAAVAALLHRFVLAARPPAGAGAGPPACDAELPLEDKA